ncbi:hypothetical protein DLAC_07632 [Tieghemostelium lacteum]|uniref:Nuclear nucleic acid-binding protein C1D n=1 Tax=Tieghemostelium lacteum TaxID=361077 RepID=A0A151ZD21_TIELA|nr:hypothetical protein DLAC_07632 [Tieghemostelium lacteum]|eukprot:KYQ91831.1 hypothetical protein DLAC_07632 [Tieghemostelium lacteum]
MTDQVLPTQIQQDISNFESILDKLETQLEPFFRIPLKEHLEKLSPNDSSKLNVTVAYALNALFFMYLQTQGISPHEHPVKSELERIKPYFLKLRNLSNKSTEEEEKPKVQVNVDATSRIINHVVATNKYQEQQQQKKRKK